MSSIQLTRSRTKLETSTKVLKILLLEDSILDVSLIRAKLKNELKFEDHVVDTRIAYIKALQEFGPDIILSDYSLPQFDGLEALALLKESSLSCPFIIITGTLDEETAVSCIKEGADDYLLKDRLVRLPAAIRHCLLQHEIAAEKESARTKLEQTQVKLRELLNKLEAVRDDEKRRISLEIHDQLGQDLTANKLGLYFLKQQLAKQEEDSSQNMELIQNKIDELIFQSGNTLKTVRKIAHQLRPIILEELGLACAIEAMISNVKGSSGINWKIINEVDNLQLDKAFALTAFRVTQEAITNVLRHAMADNCLVSVQAFENKLLISVSDDGVGVSINNNDKNGKLGLFGIDERIHQWNGILSIQSEPGNGTTLKIEFPLERVLKQHDH